MASLSSLIIYYYHFINLEVVRSFVKPLVSNCLFKLLFNSNVVLTDVFFVLEQKMRIS